MRPFFELNIGVILFDEIIKRIKRHVDDIQRMDVVYDSEDVCEFCGYDWETNTDGLPLCCDEAQKEFENHK